MCFSPAPRTVEKLSPSLLGEKVVLKGVVTDERTSQGHVFLFVNNFKTVVFQSTAKRMKPSPYSLKKGDQVAFKGRVQEYEGVVELVVEDWA
jgi:DNA/RNA endonuclease YhcR with UshA esterase domain